MINTLREMITRGGKSKVTRAQVMASRPLRNASVEWLREVPRGEETRAPIALLKIPRRRDRWGNIVARLFKLPDFRRLELDEIGSDVWEMCDGTMTVDALSKAICAKYRLNRRQGETSVTAYLRMLAERRLVALKTGKSSAATPSAKQPAQNKVRRQKRA